MLYLSYIQREKKMLVNLLLAVVLWVQVPQWSDDWSLAKPLHLESTSYLLTDGIEINNTATVNTDTDSRTEFADGNGGDGGANYAL